MQRTLAIVTAVIALAASPLFANDDLAPEPYVLDQGGEWPTHWPKELDPLRNHAGVGRFTATFWRSSEDAVHFGIRFTSREEFEAAWPHLLKVRSKDAPIILRSGRSFWIGGTSHGVCVHQQPAIWRAGGRNVPIRRNAQVVDLKPLSAEEMKEKTASSIELFVDGIIIDLDRITLPKDVTILDKRVKFIDSMGTVSGVHPEKDADALTGRSQAAGDAAAQSSTAAEKPADRTLRDFTQTRQYDNRFRTKDPLLSMYDHVWVQVTDDAKVEAVKKELARYGRVVKGHGHRVWGADVYDDVDSEAARAALAKLDGVGETGTRERGAYDKRIADLKATLKTGRKTYTVDQADGLDLTFVLTNTSRSEAREMFSIDSDMCMLDLQLQGPGAESKPLVSAFTSEFRRGELVRLEAGRSYTLPIKELNHGFRNSQQWSWNKPGKYTLTAAYTIGEVRYEAEPVTIVVVAADSGEAPRPESPASHKPDADDERIPGLQATVQMGRKTYAIDQMDRLELIFVLTNTGKGAREFLSIDSSMCRLDLKLQGPGARSDEIVMIRESSLVQRGKAIRLEPGESYRVPMTDLTYGDEYQVHQWKWTRAGRYTLTAAYVIGTVRYEAPAVKLEVVDE